MGIQDLYQLMKRRALLQHLGALGTVGVVAGCLSTDTPGSDGPTRSNRTDTDTPSDTEPIVASLRVGSRSTVAFPETNQPHGIAVVNASETDRQIGLGLTDGNDTRRINETYSIPPGGRIEVSLLVPSTYQLSIRRAGDTLGTVTIPSEYFDCNDSRTTIRVTSAGELDTQTISTQRACLHTPTVVGARASKTGSDCGSGEEASARVNPASGSLEITGIITTPSPCHGVAIAETTYTEEEDLLTIGLEPTEPAEEEVCATCLGAVGYEALVALSNAYPGTVEIVHDGAVGTRTVTRTTIKAA